MEAATSLLIGAVCHRETTVTGIGIGYFPLGVRQTLEAAGLSLRESRTPRRRPATTVIADLGGGPGVLIERLIERWPHASATLVDIDPVLLALARTTLTPRVRVVEADLAGGAWTSDAGGGYDLAISVMTVHYLPPDRVRALYTDVRRALQSGGVFIVADVMPDDGLPLCMRALDANRGEAAAELGWEQWWAKLAEDTVFEALLDARTELFACRPAADFTAEATWHRTAALDAGFAAAGMLWREGRHAAIAAVAGR